MILELLFFLKMFVVCTPRNHLDTFYFEEKWPFYSPSPISISTSHLLKLTLSRTNFLIPKGVRTIKVRMVNPRAKPSRNQILLGLPEDVNYVMRRTTCTVNKPVILTTLRLYINSIYKFAASGLKLSDDSSLTTVSQPRFGGSLLLLRIIVESLTYFHGSPLSPFRYGDRLSVVEWLLIPWFCIGNK